jgi:hypothetical protein
MAKTSIFYVSETGRAETILLDAVLGREICRSVQVTKFPIEDGSVVSDHAIKAPDSFRLEGVVSDMPVEGDAQRADDGSGDGMYAGSADMARDRLERLHDRKAPVTIQTGGRTFENFVMCELRERESGDDPRRGAYRFSASFEKVVTVSTATVALPKTAMKTKGGKKPTEKASEPVKRKKSAAKAAADALRGKAG